MQAEKIFLRVLGFSWVICLQKASKVSVRAFSARTFAYTALGGAKKQCVREPARSALFLFLIVFFTLTSFSEVFCTNTDTST